MRNGRWWARAPGQGAGDQCALVCASLCGWNATALLDVSDGVESTFIIRALNKHQACGAGLREPYHVKQGELSKSY